VRSITQCLEVVRDSGNYRDFRARFYGERLREIIADSRETVPCALSLLFLADGDPGTVIRYGANFGRDSDTIASMAGAIAGALKGASAFPTAWVTKVEREIPDHRDLAVTLAGITATRMSELRMILAECGQLLA